MFGLSIVTHELILLTVGEKWTGSIPLMQLLCIGGAFVPLNTLFSSLIISQGKSDIYMGKYHRTGRAPAPHRLSINTTGRKHLRNGGRKRVPQHRMAVRVARLCPRVHRTKSKSLTTRPASFSLFRIACLLGRVAECLYGRRPARRHFSYESHCSGRVLFPRHEDRPCRNPAECIDYLFKKKRA